MGGGKGCTTSSSSSSTLDEQHEQLQLQHEQQVHVILKEEQHPQLQQEQQVHIIKAHNRREPPQGAVRVTVQGYEFYLPSHSGTLAPAFFNEGVEGQITDIFIAYFRSSKKRHLFLDVGMNVGFFSLLAHACGQRVVAFEPQPLCVELIMRSVTDQIAVHNAFVGDKEDMAVEVSTTECFSGFSSTQAASKDQNRKIVRSVKLDDFWESTTSSGAAEPNVVIKIDTEGAELHVLRSASGLLRSGAVKLMIIELAPHVWLTDQDSTESGIAVLTEAAAHFQHITVLYDPTPYYDDGSSAVSRIGLIHGHPIFRMQNWKEFISQRLAHRAGTNVVFSQTPLEALLVAGRQNQR